MGQHSKCWLPWSRNSSADRSVSKLWANTASAWLPRPCSSSVDRSVSRHYANPASAWLPWSHSSSVDRSVSRNWANTTSAWLPWSHSSIQIQNTLLSVAVITIKQNFFLCSHQLCRVHPLTEVCQSFWPKQQGFVAMIMQFISQFTRAFAKPDFLSYSPY